MRKLHGYLLAGFLVLSAIGSAASFSVFNKKEFVKANAESYVIGTDARENYRKWGADSNLMASSTMFYVNCNKDKDGTSGSKVSKDITYTWSGCSDPLEKTSSYIEIDGGGTFTMTLTNIPNYQYLVFTRNSFYDAKGNPDMNLTITVSCGSKTPSATGTVSNGNYLNAFLDIYGGNSSTLTFYIKNNASGKVYLSSDWFDVYHASNFTFNFDKQSGSGGSDSTSVWYYFPYSKITIPSRSGYKFLGYYDSASGGTQYFKADGNPTNTTWLLDPSSKAFTDKKLYAHWEVAEQTVNVAAGTGVKSVYLSTTSTATSGKASGSKFNSGVTVYAFAELAKGYKAKSGWTKVSGTAETEGAKYRVASQTVGTTTVNFGTITADLITYTISYSGISGATVSGNPTSYNVNSNAFTLNNPTKVGYTFTGWSGTGITGKSFSVSVAKGSIGNRAYTANWDANKYDVTFDTTYGTGGIDATTLTYDSTLPDLEASQIPARESSIGHSYSFGGYYTEMPTENEDGSLTPHGKQYYNEFGKGVGLWKEASDTTLYAYWTIDMTVSSSSWSGTWSHEDGKPNVGVKHGITVTPIDPEDAVVWYGLEEGKCNSTNAEEFLRSNAGVYEIFFEVRKVGFTTYYGSETITINKDESIIDPRPTAISGLEYTALDQELVVAGEVDYGNMLYAVNTTGELPADTDFSASIPTGKLVDTYYVFYKSSGDGNHNPYDVVETEVITISIARVDRTEITNLNDTVLAYLETISEKYPDIANTLEAVRAEVYQDAIVEDNITVEGVNQNIVKLQEALSAAKVKVTETLINAIGTVSYPDSKAAIEEAKNYFDNVLNDQEQAAVNATLVETLNKDNKDYNDAKTVADLINAIPEPSDTEAYYKAVEDAKDAYDALALSNPDAYALVNGATDKEYETILENNVEAKEVIELIDAIGELTYNGGTNDSLADIESAEEAYAALKSSNPDALALVDQANHDDLVEARESYDEVDETVSLIASIGEITHGGDDDSKEALVAAREAYDALSEKEKALVNGYNNSYKTLDDDEHVYEALVLIDDIGTVSYDSESEEKINQAREYYDSLTEDQKEQLGKEPLVTLVNSETQYAELKKNANILIIILLIVVCLTIVGGIWFLFFLLKKKRKDDDDDENKGKGKPVKAMSIGGFLPGVILISHYLDAPYLALYVLAGVAVLLWISILVIAIMKKKQVGPFKKKEASTSEDEEESVTVTDENGNVFNIRYIKSFTAKLIQSPEETKKYYEELKNEVLSYKNTKSRISWHFDSINSGRNYVVKFAIRGKTLGVYLPLNADDYTDSKYKVEKVESKKYEDTPCLYRIKNDRRRDYAKELIAVVASNLGLEKGEEQHEVYSNLPYEPNKPLLERGLIKELKIQVNKPAEQQVLETKVSSDGDEIVVTKDEKGNIFEIRYIKSFTAKLSQSEKEAKDYYTILKNYALSYKDAHSRVSWHYDAINVGRDYVLKFAIRGKTLCVYFALDVSKLDEKYKVEEAKGRKYEDVPCLYRIKNDRRCEYAKELIDEVMKRVGLKQGEIPSENYSIPHESTKTLLERGLIKELKVQINKPVETVIETKEDEEGNEVVVSQDTLGNKYETRYLKSFTAKLSQASDEVKDYYNELKNHALSFKGTLSRVSWNYDTISVNNKGILKFVIKRKNLYLYYALDTSKIGQKYKVEHVEYKKYEDVPTMYMINNDKNKELSKELIDRLMRQNKCELGKNLNDEYRIPFESKEVLIKKGLIKEVKVKI